MLSMAAVCVAPVVRATAERRIKSLRSHGRQAALVRTRSTGGRFEQVSDGVFDGEVLEPLSKEQTATIVEALRRDLEGQYADGFTFTPFAADVQFVDPIVVLEGRVSYNLMWSPLWAAMNQILEPSSLVFKLKSLEVVEADADPLCSVAYPPKVDEAPKAPRDAVCAIHAVWETEGTGKVNFELGGFPVFEQQPFYMSGQDVFRVDASGRVMRHESAWDQAPSALAAYMNPIAHVPAVANIVPFFADAVPKKPTPPPPEAEDVEEGDAGSVIIPPPPVA